MQCIDLNELYQVALSNSDQNALNGKSWGGRAFGKKVTNLFADTPTGSGIYVWVRKHKNDIEYLYVGKAKNLKNRLIETAKDERCLFWLTEKTSFTEKQILEKLTKAYKTNEKKYLPHWYRAFAKSGSTHILIIPLISPALNDELLSAVEYELIKRLKPYANGNALSKQERQLAVDIGNKVTQQLTEATTEKCKEQK